jgi:nuclear pore complex protein Nup98-Nup96
VEVPSSVARGLLQQGAGAANGLNDSTYSIGTPIKKSGGNAGSLGDLDTPAPLDVPASAAPARRATPAPAALQHGDYYVTPSIEELQKLPSAKLRRVPDLVVGRVGFGEIKFTQPVDLTTLPALEDLLGGVVLFEDRYCTVYPPEFEDVKPAPGGGLNVPAVIELERCWPLDKATRLPIKDEANPKLVQHVKKLKGLAETEFIEFEAEKGRWTFRVEAF